MKNWKLTSIVCSLCLASLLVASCGLSTDEVSIGSVSEAFSVTPVTAFGQLKVVGNRICDKNGNPIQLRGMSLFWSNNGWGGEKFYNASVVNNLADTWNTPITRAALGVEGTGGYLENPADNKAKVKTVVDAAIAKGMYVIIDWHYSSATLYTSQAEAFFTEMAQTYGSYPNVIFEIYNEPTSNSWSSLKSYAETIIGAIRNAGSTNLVVVGTPMWSQDVDIAAADPITRYSNVAYALHFYAGTHRQYLRDKANTALSKGVALFVTEYGTCDASGDGNLDLSESQRWTTWMDQNRISSLNWAMNDKVETASALVAGANTTGPWSDNELTASGKWIKAYILPGYSDVDSGTCKAVPSSPTGLTATGVSPSQIDLTWSAVTAPTGCTVSYSVYRSTTSAFTPSSSNLVASGLTTALYSNTSLTASTTYYYIIQAVDEAGSSASSTQASATTQSENGSSTPCENPIVWTGQTGSFNTNGAVCYKTNAVINGWGCSNFEGRAIQVNNTTVTCGVLPLPAKLPDGYYYFAVSAGSYTWASMYYW